MVTDGCVNDAVVSASVLRAAMDLIADQGEAEARAYQRGVLIGFARGWHHGLLAGSERGTAA